MARQRNRKRAIADINVVPYIDVMLVMLVIFMITAPLLNQGVDVELPQAEAEPIDSDKPDPVILSVDASGRYFLNMGSDPEKPIDAETLMQQVAVVLRNRPDAAVMVRGDARVDYGVVVAAMSLLQQAGAARVGLVTEPPKEDR